MPYLEPKYADYLLGVLDIPRTHCAPIATSQIFSWRCNASVLDYRAWRPWDSKLSLSTSQPRAETLEKIGWNSCHKAKWCWARIKVSRSTSTKGQIRAVDRWVGPVHWCASGLGQFTGNSLHCEIAFKGRMGRSCQARPGAGHCGLAACLFFIPARDTIGASVSVKKIPTLFRGVCFEMGHGFWYYGIKFTFLFCIIRFLSYGRRLAPCLSYTLLQHRNNELPSVVR